MTAIVERLAEIVTTYKARIAAIVSDDAEVELHRLRHAAGTLIEELEWLVEQGKGVER